MSTQSKCERDQVKREAARYEREKKHAAKRAAKLAAKIAAKRPS